jgi:pimeloyl-ACP methyl ester carboxylesterase
MSNERCSEAITLTMPGGELLRGVYEFTRGTTSAPVVVFAHGFCSTRGGEKATALAEECVRRGWSFAAVDFRGHGESDGRIFNLTGPQLLADLSTVVRYARVRASGPVFIVGSSMGGWAGAWLAIREPKQIQACAFIAPAFRFLELWNLTDEDRAAWERTGRLRMRNRWIDVEVGWGLAAEAVNFKFHDLVAGFNLPALIFHGMQDDSVPFALSLEFAAETASKDVELLIIKEGDHRLLQYRERMARESCDFFARHLSPSI